MPTRDYEQLAKTVHSQLKPGDDRTARMQCVSDAIWEALSGAGVSWGGFYIADEGAPEDQRLILGPRRDKPACSPIGVHGVCGAAYLSKRIQIVRDVRDLGPNYVACDPRDQSEIVIPLFESPDANTGWGVLDLDSFETGAFDETDAAGLVRVLTAAGFHCAAPETATSTTNE